MQGMLFIQYTKEGNETTVESNKCVSYTTEMISMVIPVISGALGSVTKRLVDS